MTTTQAPESLPNPSDMSIAEMLAEARLLIRSLNEVNDKLFAAVMGAQEDV